MVSYTFRDQLSTDKNLFISVAGVNPVTGEQTHIYGRKGMRRSSENFKHARLAIYCGTGGAESLHKIKSFEVTDRIRVLRDLFQRLNSI